MSISGDKTFTGDIIFESNIHMNGGNVLVANTVNMTVSDPIIELGSNNLNTGDLGIIMTRHGATNSNVAFVYDEDVDILRMGYTLNGASDSVVDLDSNALAVSVQGALSAANITTDDYLIHDGDTDTKVGFPSADTFTVTTAGSERLCVDSSGNVGIGVAIPAAKFDVRGASHDPSIPTVHIGDNTADAGDYGMVNLVRHATSGGSKAHLAFIRNGNTVTAMGFHSNTNTFGIWTSFGGVTTTPRLSIDSVGNVGIGTASPLEKLDVYGTSRISSAYPKLDFFCTTGRSTNAWGNSTGAAGDYRIYSNGDASDGNKRSLNFDYGQNTAHTTRMCINADGNVGIGTTSPRQKLEITNGNIALVNTAWKSSGDDDQLAGKIDFHLGGNSGQQNTPVASIEGYDKYAGGSYYGALAFKTHGTERMRINDGGNVGIGTVTVDAPLHIFKTAATASDIGAGIKLERWDNYGCSIWSQYHGSVDCMNFRVVSNATDAYGGTPQMVLTHQGRVGIGTTGPDTQLHIGPKDNNHIYLASANNNYGWKLDTVDQQAGSVPFRIIKRTGGTDSTVLTIKNQDGNVGIGTVSPVAQLHVASNGPTYTAIGGNDRFRIEELVTNGNKFGLQMGIDWGTGHSALQTYALSSGGSYSQNYSLLLQPHGGNVGIGTTGPSSRLHVNGRIMSNQPRFFAWSNSGSTSFNSGATCVLNATAYNSGSHYSTSTGYFTAPVNGVYSFTVGIYTYNALQFSWKLVPTAGSLSSNNAHVSRNNGTGDDLLILQAWNSGQYSGAITIYLNANEQFGWGSRSGSGNFYGAHSHFSGYLLSPV
jgi:hypothetical protein